MRSVAVALCHFHLMPRCRMECINQCHTLTTITSHTETETLTLNTTNLCFSLHFLYILNSLSQAQIYINMIIGSVSFPNKCLACVWDLNQAPLISRRKLTLLYSSVDREAALGGSNGLWLKNQNPNFFHKYILHIFMYIENLPHCMSICVYIYYP